MVSSNVIALILREARMASLSAKVGSSLDGTLERGWHNYVGRTISLLTLAERMTHMSHRFTFTALRSARLRGEP